MAEETGSPLAIFMYLFRMLPAIGFVVLMVVLFFSLKVTIINNDLQRFNMELSDAMSGIGLSSERSVFNAGELKKLETTTKEIEFYARQCEYSYTIEVKSLIEREVICEQGQSCASFGESACGAGSEFRCNTEIFGDNFCECKKGDNWISRHEWRFGTDPSSYREFEDNFAETEGGLYESAEADFPIAIDVNGKIIQAVLHLKTYDSFLTRLTCSVQKSYTTKETIEFGFQPNKIPVLDPTYYPSLIFRRTEGDGTHVCLYQLDSRQNQLPVQCRYMPGIPVKEIYKEWDALLEKAKFIQVYPMKTEDAECPAKEDQIAGEEDEVATVIICVK